jgi:hypothetical protein
MVPLPETMFAYVLGTSKWNRVIADQALAKIILPRSIEQLQSYCGHLFASLGSTEAPLERKKLDKLVSILSGQETRLRAAGVLTDKHSLELKTLQDRVTAWERRQLKLRPPPLEVVSVTVPCTCYQCKERFEFTPVAAAGVPTTVAPAADDLCPGCRVSYLSPEARSKFLSRAETESKRDVSQDPFLRRAVTSDKKRVNEQLVEETEPVVKGRNASTCALTLDGADLHTSQLWIQKLGLVGAHITVANPFLASRIRAQQCEHLAKKKETLELSRVAVQPLFACDAMLAAAASKGTSFNLMFLDYCCTWRGNDHTKPRVDVDCLFRHQLLCSAEMPNAVLAVSLCFRTRPDDNEALLRPRQRMFAVVEWICNRAGKYGYRAIPSEKCDTYTSMYFLLFHVTKCVPV